MPDRIEVDHDYELISFEVHLQTIKFRFGPLAIELFDHIEMISSGQDHPVVVLESVWDRKGDLNAFWPLIGKRMTKLIMDMESCRILFADGTILRRKYERAPLADIWGPEPDNFSSYPENIMDRTAMTDDERKLLMMGGKEEP